MMQNRTLLLSIFMFVCFTIVGQTIEEKVEFDQLEEKRTKLIDSLTYQTASGLPIAASKIYFSDSKFTISGFVESNVTHYRGNKNTASGDLELYQTNLQRFVTYMAYKPKDWLVLYAEIFAEFANDGNNESELEYLPEFFIDFLIKDYFNVRVGTHQPQIGYINNNDEPVMFYSVNRPEVERLIIPSQWIDLGLMTYGNISEKLKWSLSVYQGLDASTLNGSTWLRGGREDVLRFNLSNQVINSSLKYTNKSLEIGLNGIMTRLDLGNTSDQHNTAQTYLSSMYVKKEWDNWTIMALGSFGTMSNSEAVFEFTKNESGIGQVLGEQVYGYYIEAGYDILPVLGLNKKSNKKNGKIIRSHEMKMPIFARYERLNSHASINPELEAFLVGQSDLEAITVGLNFNPRRSIVIKANYQFRTNDALLSEGVNEGNRLEFGLGFIF